MGLDFPSAATGATNVPGSVTITATGDQPPAPLYPLSLTKYIGICNSPTDITGAGDCGSSALGAPYDQGVVLTPSCAQATDPSLGTSGDCQVPDPGVFSVSPTATGSGDCAGTTFDVTTLDATVGSLHIVPRPAGSHILLGSPGSFCTISFTFDVLKAPSDAAPGTAGAQTRTLVSAGGGYNAATTGIFGHYKPAPLKAVGSLVSSQVCAPPTTGTPPNCVPPPPPVCTPPTTGTPPNCVPPPPPPVISSTMSAAISGTAKCVGGLSRRAPKRRPAGATNKPFDVTVQVAGPPADVARVEFRRNGHLIKTLTKGNKGSQAYVLHVVPGKLKLHSKYAITSRVVVKAPGTFKPGDSSALVKNLGPVTFVATNVCSRLPARTTG